MTLTNIAEAKTQAKALRKALAAQGVTISHAQALELLAQQQGERDWNTLHAKLAKSLTLQLNQILKGRYMGQFFEGTLISIAKKGSHYQIVIQLDKPIDTVTFSSFSNHRKRLRAVINSDGQSLAKTSDGVPHLVIEGL